MEVIETFCDYFGADRLARLDEETAIIYGLTEDLRLGLLNKAWGESARKNHAPPEFFEKYGLGGSYMEAISPVLRPFFESHIRASIESRTSWTFDYQCPTPHEYAKYRMQVLPMARRLGCIITNACIVKTPHDQRDASTTPDAHSRGNYVDSSGQVTMCVHCRRTRRVGLQECWDWVADFVEKPPQNLSQSICPSCLAYFAARADIA